MPKTFEQIEYSRRVKEARDYAKHMEVLLDKLINTRIIPSMDTMLDLRRGIESCRTHARKIKL